MCTTKWTALGSRNWETLKDLESCVGSNANEERSIVCGQEITLEGSAGPRVEGGVSECLGVGHLREAGLGFDYKPQGSVSTPSSIRSQLKNDSPPEKTAPT